MEELWNNRTRIVEAYQKEEENFKAIQKQLVSIFEEIVKTKASDFKLVGKNVYGQVKYYELLSRVKKPSSFEEKFLRKEFGLKFLQEPNIKEADIIPKVKKELDDLIGIRIVTWVNEDRPNVWELIKASVDEFTKLGIEFSDLYEQPQNMKNGLTIYRIKGNFQGCWFELQIKSRLEEAWAEIEHSQFYKNPSYSRERNVYREMILKCYNILEQIDSTLHLIRDKSGENPEVDRIIKLESIIKKFSEKFEKELTFPVDLIPFQHLLLNLTFPETIYLDINVKDSLFKNSSEFYNDARRNDWKLIISEAIFKSHDHKIHDFDEYLKFLVDLFFKFNILKPEVSKEPLQIEKDIFLECLKTFWDLDVSKKATKTTISYCPTLDKVFEFIQKNLPNLRIAYTDEEYSKWNEKFKHLILRGFSAIYSKLAQNKIQEKRIAILKDLKVEIESKDILEILDDMEMQYDELDLGRHLETLFQLPEEN